MSDEKKVDIDKEFKDIDEEVLIKHFRKAVKSQNYTMDAFLGMFWENDLISRFTSDGKLVPKGSIPSPLIKNLKEAICNCDVSGIHEPAPVENLFKAIKSNNYDVDTVLDILVEEEMLTECFTWDGEIILETLSSMSKENG